MRIFLFALLLGWALPGLAQNATVADGTHVNLRAGKTDNYRVLRVLPPQTPVQIVEIANDMAKVATKEGETGWVPARLLVMEPMDLHPTTSQPEEHAPSPNIPAQAVGMTDSKTNELDDAGNGLSWRLLLVGLLCFAVGTAVGIGLHEAYYRKRLNGLRI